jgi:hypothetical protein
MCIISPPVAVAVSLKKMVMLVTGTSTSYFQIVCKLLKEYKKSG